MDGRKIQRMNDGNGRNNDKFSFYITDHLINNASYQSEKMVDILLIITDLLPSSDLHICDEKNGNTIPI